jgi:hypothetical protein
MRTFVPSGLPNPYSYGFLPYDIVATLTAIMDAPLQIPPTTSATNPKKEKTLATSALPDLKSHH